MSDTVTVTWSFVRLTGLLNAKEGRSHRKRYEHREAGVQQIHDLFVVKIKKKNLKNQYWIGFEGANSDNTSMTLMSAQCFSVICLLDVRCICMESDLCWLCVTVLAVVWEVLCHKAFRKVIQWKNTGRIHIWLSWMNGILHSGTANCFQVFQTCISAAVWLRSGNDSWNGFRSRSWFGLKWEVDYLFCSGGINYVC